VAFETFGASQYLNCRGEALERAGREFLYRDYFDEVGD
jgi:hypothetical protein